MFRDRRIAALAAVAVVAWTIVSIVVSSATDPGLVDLQTYRAGGAAWLRDRPLYDPGFPWTPVHRPLPFTYPPIAAVAFALLAVLPWWAAVALLIGGCVAAVAVVSVLVLRRLTADRTTITALAIGAVAAAAMLEPVRDTVAIGQVNLALAALVTADCLLRRTPWPRGALMGVAAAIKLTPFAFALFFVARRQWRPVVVAAGAFVATSLLGWVLAPGDTREYWLDVLPASARIGAPEYAGNQSLHGTIARLGLPSGVTTAVWLASAAVVGALALVAVARSRRRGDDVAALVVTAAAALLVSPVSWSHHWVWVVPGLLWLAHRAWQRRSAPLAAAVVAGLVVFTSAPHFWLPHRDGREFDWAVWQHVVGSTYVAIALAVVIVAVLAGRRPAITVSRAGASGSSTS